MALRLPYLCGSLLRQSRRAGLVRPISTTTLSSRYGHGCLCPQSSTHTITRSLLPTPSTSPPPRPHSSTLIFTIQPQPYTTDQSTNDKPRSTEPVKPKSSTEKIKVILREYGTVAVVFHTCVSLCSLGTCYLLVSNGLDVDKVLEYFNITASGTKKGASTFAIAYVLHKVFLPLRALITVGGVPLIVRKLRALGWMKGSVKTVANQVKNQAK